MANRYWVGDSGNWSDTAHWSTISGGSSGASVPTFEDDVFFDGNSFSLPGQIVTLEAASISDCHNMDWTGVTHAPELNFGGSTEMNVWGSIFKLNNLLSVINPEGGIIYFYNDVGSVLNLTSAGNILPGMVFIPGTGSAHLSLQDDLTLAGSFELQNWHDNLTNGTINTNGNDITCAGNFSARSLTPITLGASVITAAGDIDLDYAAEHLNNLSAASAKLIMTGAGTYFYTSPGHIIGELDAQNSCLLYATHSTVNTLRLTAGKTYTIWYDLLNVRDQLKIGTDLIAVGTPGNLISIRSSVAGSRRKIRKTSGTISVSYVDIKDSDAAGGATFNVTNAVNSGNNIGWNFLGNQKNQTGKGNVRASKQRTQTGTGNIKVTAPRTITGKANIRLLPPKFQTGVARITVTTDRDQLGKGAVKKTTTRLLTGVSKIDPTPNFPGKKFEYKVYESDGTYIGTISQWITSDFITNQAINDAGSQFVMRLGQSPDNFGEGVMIKHNNNVKVYVHDQDVPSGLQIFDGFIADYTPFFTPEGDYVDVTVVGYGAMLDKNVIEDDGDTFVQYFTQDPSDILRDILDKYAAAGGKITYTEDSIDDTGTVTSYDFNTNTTMEGIDKCLELAPAGWYFYIDQATNVLHFHQKVDTPDYLFLLDKHISHLEVKKSIEPVINIVLFTGGDVGNPLAPLFKRYERAGSIAEFGPRVLRMQDGRVKLSATAATMSNSVLDNHAAAELSTTIKIIDNAIDNTKGFDLETIILGKMIAIGGPGIAGVGASLWDRMDWEIDNWDYDLANISTLVLQITKLDYNGDEVTLSLSTIPPDVNKRIEDINRNLQALETANNPVAPS